MEYLDTSAAPKIHVTAEAQEKITDVIVSEGQGNRLRLYVQGGGCSGLQYGMAVDPDLNMDDFCLDIGCGIQVVVDSTSAGYLDGAKIKYEEGLMGSGFTIDNPNATHTCGCGSSFSP